MGEFLHNLGMEKAFLIMIQNPDLRRKKIDKFDHIKKRQNSFMAKKSQSQKTSNKLGESIFDIYH